MTLVAVINGRRIREREPIGMFHAKWWLVDTRSAITNKGRLVAFQKFDSLADAVAEAERLGPMIDEPGNTQ